MSNYSAADISTLLQRADITPAVNQVEFSPFEYCRALQQACQDHGIAVEAYSPLGTGAPPE